MAEASNRRAWALGMLTCVVAAHGAAQAQTIYRYIDSDHRVVYSDHTPAGASHIQVIKLGQNLIETDAPIGARMAQERFPVTFYTFACGDLCQRGETLLNRRGVPYATVDVSQADGAERLKRLTGELQAPVLQVGDRLIAKGFNENVWQGLLTDAGYPQTPPPRRIQLARPPLDVPPAPATPPAGGYPK